MVKLFNILGALDESLSNSSIKLPEIASSISRLMYSTHAPVCGLQCSFELIISIHESNKWLILHLITRIHGKIQTRELSEVKIK